VRFLTCLLSLMCLAALGASADRADEDVIARIKMEGIEQSQVADTLSWLADVHGPRLPGSPAFRAAAEWARARLAGWGLQNARHEEFGPGVRGWTLERFTLDLVEPQYMRLTGYPKAWSRSTTRPIVGTPVLVAVQTEADFPAYRSKLRDAIVMNGRPALPDRGFQPEAARSSDSELRRQEQQLSPTAPGFGPFRPRSFVDERRESAASRARREAIELFFEQEGIAALLEPSDVPHGVVRVAAFSRNGDARSYPAFVLAAEHYGRLVRLLDRNASPKVELSVRAHLDAEDHRGANVIAEIPGEDPALREQIVLIGAHLDSWHAGTGAIDNGAGCAAMMEAVRILKALELPMRRTVRIALWYAEEGGYLGSIGYVEKHVASLETLEPRAGHAAHSVYFNLDNGTGRIRGINLQGNEAVRPIFDTFLAPLRSLGASTLTTLNTGGTDHMPFDAVGIPAFQFIQDPIDYENRTVHTSLDLYEAAIEEDLQQAAIVVASLVYHVATRDQPLPRKPALSRRR
jgi:carboxypeptidase Q